MENLVVGKNVIASNNEVYGFGKCISQDDDGNYSVLLKRGYKIENGKMVNINDDFELKIQSQKDRFFELREFMYENGYTSYDLEGDKVNDYYDSFVSLEKSDVEEGTEKEFRFSRDQIIELEDDCDNPRLIWSENLTWKERLGIIGKLLLDPAEYDNCIVGYDDNCVYYNLEEIIWSCSYLMPDCDPADNVYNNMIRACQYISSAPYIRFVEDYEMCIDRQMEMDSEDEEIEEISFNGQSWAVVD